LIDNEKGSVDFEPRCTVDHLCGSGREPGDRRDVPSDGILKSGLRCFPVNPLTRSIRSQLPHFKPIILGLTWLTNVNQLDNNQDAVTGQKNVDRRVRFARLKPYLEELALGHFPNVVECIDWEAFGKHYAPLLRHHLRALKASPHRKSSLKIGEGDTH